MPPSVRSVSRTIPWNLHNRFVNPFCCFFANVALVKLLMSFCFRRDCYFYFMNIDLLPVMTLNQSGYEQIDNVPPQEKIVHRGGGVPSTGVWTESVQWR